jgi:hypothetical protein
MTVRIWKAVGGGGGGNYGSRIGLRHHSRGTVSMMSRWMGGIAFRVSA